MADELTHQQQGRMLFFPMEPETPFSTERYEFGRQDLPKGFSLSKRIRAKKGPLCPGDWDSCPLPRDTRGLGTPPQEKPDWQHSLSLISRGFLLTSALFGKPLCPQRLESTVLHQETSGWVDTATWAACLEKLLCPDKPDFLPHSENPSQSGRETLSAPTQALPRGQWKS